MKKNTNSVFYAGITVVIVIASFVYTWKFIIPQYSENKAKSAQFDTDIASANKKLESLKKAQTTLTQLGDIPTQLSVSVPEDKDLPNLITELEAVAAKYNKILPTISVSDGAASSAVAGASTSTSASGNAVTISIAIPGSFEDINGFIADLEKDVRFMNIKSVSISSSTDTGGASTMSVALQIEAYKRGVTAATTSSSASATTATSGGE